MNMLSSSISISINNFSDAREASCLYVAMVREISLQACQQLRPKAKISGLDMEANQDSIAMLSR